MNRNYFLAVLFMGLMVTACNEKAQTDTVTVTEEKNENSLGGNYVIDPQTSDIKWKGSKPTGVHNGVVPIASGSVQVENGNITGGTIVMDMNGITVLDLEGKNKENLEAHLKGKDPGKEEDFFNVDKFPTATYTIKSSTALENDPEATHMINGDLTIKDITKPASFKANIKLTNNKLTAETPEFAIDRTLYDIKFKSRKFFNDLQDDFVNDDFSLQINVTANKQ